MKRLLSIAAGLLLLAGPAPALPAPADTPEELAQQWCADYQRPGTLEQVSQRALGVRVDAFNNARLRQLLSKSFLQHSTRANGCAMNLRGLAEALETFRQDHQGKYPQKLGELVPEYVDQPKICPAGGVDSYSPSYRPAPEGQFTLFCAGSHHQSSGLAEDQPSFGWKAGTVQGLPEPRPAERTCEVVSVTRSDQDPSLALARLQETTAAELDAGPVSHSATLAMVQTPAGWVVADIRLDEQQDTFREALMGAYLIEYWGMPTPDALADVVAKAVRAYASYPPLEQLAIMGRLSKEPVANLLNDDFSMAHDFQQDIQGLRGLAARAVLYRREKDAWPPAGVLVDLGDPDTRPISLRPSPDGRELEISFPDSAYAGFKVPQGYPRVVVDSGGRMRFLYRP